jgi:hypothetical protein
MGQPRALSRDELKDNTMKFSRCTILSLCTFALGLALSAFTLSAQAFNTRPAFHGTTNFGTLMPNVEQVYTLTLANAKATRMAFSSPDGAFSVKETTCVLTGGAYSNVFSKVGCTVTVAFKAPLGGHYKAYLAAWNINMMGQANLTGKVYGPDYILGAYTTEYTLHEGDRATIDIPLFSVGTEPLVISGLAVTGWWGVTNNCPAMLMPGTMCTLTLNLAAGEGPFEGFVVPVTIRPLGNTGTTDAAAINVTVTTE